MIILVPLPKCHVSQKIRLSQKHRKVVDLGVAPKGSLPPTLPANLYLLNHLLFILKLKSINKHGGDGNKNACSVNQNVQWAKQWFCAYVICLVTFYGVLYRTSGNGNFPNWKVVMEELIRPSIEFSSWILQLVQPRWKFCRNNLNIIDAFLCVTCVIFERSALFTDANTPLMIYFS